jgi:hypothetical protein
LLARCPQRGISWAFALHREYRVGVASETVIEMTWRTSERGATFPRAIAEAKVSVKSGAVALVTLAVQVTSGCGARVESAAVDDGGTGPAEAAHCAAVASAGSAYQVALEAVRSCDPQSSAMQCPGGTVIDLYGCQFPSNADQASRARLVAAIAEYQAAVELCGMGLPYAGGCQGWPGGAVATCLPAGTDAGGGFCGYR